LIEPIKALGFLVYSLYMVSWLVLVSFFCRPRWKHGITFKQI